MFPIVPARIDEWVTTSLHEFDGKALANTRRRSSAVRVTNRLTDSPACLVSNDGGLRTNLERLRRAAGQAVPDTKPILEVNPAHPIVRRLAAEANPARFDDWSQILFDQAAGRSPERLPTDPWRCCWQRTAAAAVRNPPVGGRGRCQPVAFPGSLHAVWPIAGPAA